MNDSHGLCYSYPRSSATASSWLTNNGDLLPAVGRALDVACGRGRNALWLGERGYATTALDRDEEAVRVLNEEARRRSLPVHAEVVDLEAPGVTLGTAAYDAIVVVHYLHRPLFPALLDALRPGGVLVYETFTRAQAARGKPAKGSALDIPAITTVKVKALGWLASLSLARSARLGPLYGGPQRVQNSRLGPYSGPSNPAFLLESGELARLVQPLEILREREGEFEGRMVAGVIARRRT